MIGGGNIISFEIASKRNKEREKSFSFLNNLSLIKISNNLGDTKSLITHPETTTHNKLSKMEKKSLGINSNLIRISVGLENINDLIDDLDKSLKKSMG